MLQRILSTLKGVRTELLKLDASSFKDEPFSSEILPDGNHISCESQQPQQVAKQF